MNYIDLIRLNRYSRPGKVIDARGIVVHWTACPKATARNTRNYFYKLAFQDPDNKKNRYASAHFAVDEIEDIQIIPTDEIAYHVGAYKYTRVGVDRFESNPNKFLIGIEMCHDDMSGKFHEKTIENTIKLCGRLCRLLELDPMKDIYRHYDITGKPCPKWFVKHEDDYVKFKEAISERIQQVAE